MCTDIVGRKSEIEQTGKFSFDVNDFVCPSTQGEDGFPGFKGDMGIKGDRVRARQEKNNNTATMLLLLSNRKSAGSK